MVSKTLTMLMVALMVTGVFEKALSVKRYGVFKEMNWDRSELGDYDVRFDGDIDDGFGGILDKLKHRRGKLPTCPPNEVRSGMKCIKKR